MPKSSKRKILLATVGGDCPGLNAVVRAAVLASESAGIELYGSAYGFEGILRDDPPVLLTPEMVSGSLTQGGSVLGSSNRCDPYRWAGGDHHLEFLARLKKWQLEGMLVVGGEGTLDFARHLVKDGFPCVLVPKSIDNDLPLGADSIGFWSAVEYAVENIDALRVTGESHHRVMMVEVMGRGCGHLALNSGIAGGADAILIPELPFDLPRLVACLGKRQSAVARPGLRPRGSLLIVVAEGANPNDVVSRESERLFKEIDWDLRFTRLGYTQRGCAPGAWDRFYGSLYGAYAVQLVKEKKWNRFVTHRGDDSFQLIDLPLTDSVNTAGVRGVATDDVRVAHARTLGILFGDEK